VTPRLIQQEIEHYDFCEVDSTDFLDSRHTVIGTTPPPAPHK
jgi:hypothetical protein